MKSKYIVFVLAIFFTNIAMGQTSNQGTNQQSKMSTYESRIDSLLSKIDTLVMINNELLEHLDVNTLLIIT